MDRAPTTYSMYLFGKSYGGVVSRLREKKESEGETNFNAGRSPGLFELERGPPTGSESHPQTDPDNFCT